MAQPKDADLVPAPILKGFSVVDSELCVSVPCRYANGRNVMLWLWRAAGRTPAIPQGLAYHLGQKFVRTSSRSVVYSSLVFLLLVFNNLRVLCIVVE